MAVASPLSPARTTRLGRLQSGRQRLVSSISTPRDPFPTKSVASGRSQRVARWIAKPAMINPNKPPTFSTYLGLVAADG